MRREGKWAIGAVVAAGIGYIAGLLTAPKSGKQTRGDIAKTASKARTEGEKQLKILYSELGDTVEKAEEQLKKVRGKANQELKEAVASARVAKEKTKVLLSALREGDADDPELKKMIKQAKQAKTNLSKFLNK